MKFKIAAVAILNLLFLSILVKPSISGGSRLHCKISFMYVNWRVSYCKFGLKFLLRPPQKIIFIVEAPKGISLRGNTRFEP